MPQGNARTISNPSVLRDFASHKPRKFVLGNQFLSGDYTTPEGHLIQELVLVKLVVALPRRECALCRLELRRSVSGLSEAVKDPLGVRVKISLCTSVPQDDSAACNRQLELNQ